MIDVVKRKGPSEDGPIDGKLLVCVLSAAVLEHEAHYGNKR